MGAHRAGRLERLDRDARFSGYLYRAAEAAECRRRRRHLGFAQPPRRTTGVSRRAGTLAVGSLRAAFTRARPAPAAGGLARRNALGRLARAGNGCARAGEAAPRLFPHERQRTRAGGARAGRSLRRDVDPEFKAKMEKFLGGARYELRATTQIARQKRKPWEQRRAMATA